LRLGESNVPLVAPILLQDIGTYSVDHDDDGKPGFNFADRKCPTDGRAPASRMEWFSRGEIRIFLEGFIKGLRWEEWSSGK
jgi:hypothetical protein